MSLEEVFGICVLVALVAFCAGWSMGDMTGYSEGYHDGWNCGRFDLARSLEFRMSVDDGEDEDG